MPRGDVYRAGDALTALRSPPSWSYVLKMLTPAIQRLGLKKDVLPPLVVLTRLPRIV